MKERHIQWIEPEISREKFIERIPQEIYRFYDFEDVWTDNTIITNQEIYLARSSDFDADYPECTLPTDYSTISNELLDFISLKKVRQENPYAPERDINQIAINLRKLMKINDLDHRVQAEIRNRKRIDELLGIVCFTDTYKSIEIWEKLGNLGTGFCVGFDTYKLWSQKKLYGTIGYVDYYDELPMISPIALSDEERIKKRIKANFSVPSKYSYEREIRIVKSGINEKTMKLRPYSESDRVVFLPKELYMKIILGYDMLDDQKNEVKYFCNENFPSMEIYETTISKNREIGIERINL